MNVSRLTNGAETKHYRIQSEEEHENWALYAHSFNILDRVRYYFCNSSSVVQWSEFQADNP
jgi:hypothetical protein